MMKMYKHYSAVLLIGLLSLNILSSCVTAKKDHILCPAPSSVQAFKGCVQRLYNVLPGCNKVACVVGLLVFGVVVGVVVPISYYVFSNDPGNKLIIFNTNNNSTMESRPWLIDEQKIGTIIRSTTNNPADGFSSTVPTTVVTTEPTSPLTTNTRTRLVLKDPMFLDKQVLQHVKQHCFSKEIIAYWLGKGLHVDAQDQKGQTLLMHLYNDYNPIASDRANCSMKPKFNRKMKLILFLIDNKANLDLQDGNGNTILMHTAHKFDFAMISTFIGSRANPSVPNKKGDTPKSFLQKNAFNKLQGYSKEEIDFLIEQAFEKNRPKGE